MVSLLYVVEFPTAFDIETARAQMDAFREAVLPSLNHDLTIAECDPDKVIFRDRVLELIAAQPSDRGATCDCGVVMHTAAEARVHMAAHPEWRLVSGAI